MLDFDATLFRLVQLRGSLLRLTALLKHRLLCPSPSSVSDSVGLGWDGESAFLASSPALLLLLLLTVPGRRCKYHSLV